MIGTEPLPKVQIRSTVSALLAALTAAQPFVAKKTTLPVLQYARLVATEHGGTIDATDLQLGYLGPTEMRGDGTVLVPAHQLAALLKNCETDAVVLLSHTRAGMLRVRVGSEARYTLPSVGSAEFPARRDGAADALQIGIDAAVVAAALRGVMFAMSTDMIRLSLAGIDLRGHGTCIEATATDGHVLAHVELQSTPTADFTVLLPSDAIAPMLSWLESRSAARVTIGIEPAFVTLTDTDTTLTARLIEATFVEWRLLVPAQVGDCFQVERAALMHCVNRGYALHHAKSTCFTRLTSQQGSLLIETLQYEDIIAQEVVPCQGAAPGTFIRLRTYQLLEALQAVAPTESTVHLGIRSPLEACLLYGQERAAHFALIAPLKDGTPGVWKPEEEEAVEESYATV